MEKIENELNKKANKLCDLSNEICKMICEKKLLDESIFEEQYNHFKNIDYIYDFLLNANVFINLKEQKQYQLKNEMQKDISSEFFTGFGIENTQ